MIRYTLAALFVYALAPTSHADVVHRQAGDPLLGAVRSGGGFAPVVVETVDGPVEVARADVLFVESGHRLARALSTARAGLAADDVRGRVRLVEWALRKGEFEAALELADEATRLGREAGTAVPLPPELVEVPVRDIRRNETLDRRMAGVLLDAAADSDRPASAQVAIARLQRGADGSSVRERLLEGLESRKAAMRGAAVAALSVGTMGAGGANPTVLPALLERMLEDEDAAVRAAAIDAVRSHSDDRVTLAVVRGLRRDDARRREAAMDAVEALHLVRATGQLVRNLRRVGPSPAPSGYTAITTQEAFVQDFDVDVANSAFIANPNIGTLQTGVVLNAKLLDTTTSRSRGLGPRESARIAGLLSRLTGESIGPDATRWTAWLESQRP